jgi:phosphoribosylanthranilate isomerase
MRTRVKVCCIASVAEAALAVAHGADALGLVGPMPSGPGPIDAATIAEVAAWAPPGVATFLLTASLGAEAIAAEVRAAGVSTVQVVSHIDRAESAALARLLPAIRRVQVIHVEDRAALGLIGAYAPHVHAFLLDSGRPSLAVPELGGTGRVHDWAVSRAFVAASPRPVFLAGGLNPANAAQAVAEVGPFGLDLCSGLRPQGALDAALLRAFMAAVARAHRERR